jgi:Tfp pilus assembly protein PilN
MNSYIPRTVVGVEVAGQDLRVAVLRSAFGKRRLVSSFAVRGFVGMEAAERIQELVKVAERHALEGARIFLSLPESNGLVRELEFPLEVRERIRSVVQLQVEDLSPWVAEEVYWDMSWKDPGRAGKSLIVNVSILAREKLDPWIELFEAAGLPLTGVTLSTFAAGHAAKVLWPDAVPTLLVRLESEYAEGCLVTGRRIRSVSLAEGGPAPERTGRIIRRLRSLARMTSLESARTVAYGSGRGNLAADNPPIPMEGAAGDSGRIFGALGAALSGLGESPFAVNLVPAEKRHRSDRLQLVPTLALVALLAIVAGLLVLRGPYQWSTYASELDAQIRAIAPTVQDLTEQEVELNALSEKYRALSGHLEGTASTLESLRELVRVLPSDAWISAFSLQAGNATISGFSASASEIQRLIEESPLFGSAEFASSVTRNEAGRDRFTLRFIVGGDS